MKKLKTVIKIFMALALAFFVLQGTVFAASSEDHRQWGSFHCLTVTMVADTGAATFTSYSTSQTIDGAIVAMETAPGATAPTAGYDVTVTNVLTRSVMGTLLNDLSATAAEYGRAPNGVVYNSGTLTVAAANNSVNDATFTLKIYWYGSERKR